MSAAALSGLVHLQSVWAHADADAEATRADAGDAVDGLDAVDQRSAAAAAVARVPSEVRSPANDDVVATPTAEPIVAAAEPDAPEGPEPVEPTAASLITVPDLSGMTVGLAVKTLRGIGLRVSIQDEYGDRVYVEDWQAYKVRKQRIDPGTQVEPGSRVRLDAKYRRRFAKGY